MNKSEYVKVVSDKVGLSKSKISDVLDVFIQEINKDLVENGRTLVAGLGTFTVSTKTSRTWKNPRTGEKEEVPVRRKVQFKASQQTIDKLN